MNVEAQIPAALEDLARLVAMPSVSSLPEHDQDTVDTANHVADLLRGAGCPDVRVVQEGGKPAVIGRFPAPAGRPTVCLYAHYDVQPTGDVSAWTTPPFEATKRGERLFGRGTADDKAGVVLHLAVLRAFGGQPPVGVTVFVEGEEEIGSPSLGRLLEAHRDLLDADIYVIADSVNWQVGEPALTTTLRGLADCTVEVRTLDHALHSGQYGGVVPDALTSLCRLLATLHTPEGDVAVAGLKTSDAAGLDYPLDRLREETGLLADFIGTGSVVERMWTKPSITVLAIDATAVKDASNTLAPVARAKVSLRVAPGDDAHRAMDALIAHLEDHAPWGAQVAVTRGDVGQPGVIDSSSSAYDTAAVAFAEGFGTEVVQIGCGGSIPMVAEFQSAFPNAAILVSAVVDPDSRMHGIDESLHLGDFAKAAKTEALFLAGLAE